MAKAKKAKARKMKARKAGAPKAAARKAKKAGRPLAAVDIDPIPGPDPFKLGRKRPK
jgi:hypothetical protein